MSISRKGKGSPLYVQIKHILKDRILHGIYPLGTNIPSEPQLEDEFKVSKITVRGAIQELVQEGYLEKGSGKGTKVIRNTAASKLSKWKHFTEILVEEGRQIRKQWLGADIEELKQGTELYRMFGERCHRLERLYVLDGEPYIYYVHRVPIVSGGIELTDLRDRSLYELLEERGIAMERLRDEFEVELPSPNVRQVLGLEPDIPVLKRLRYSYDPEGGLCEYSVGCYHTQKQRYIVKYDV